MLQVTPRGREPVAVAANSGNPWTFVAVENAQIEGGCCEYNLCLYNPGYAAVGSYVTLCSATYSEPGYAAADCNVTFCLRNKSDCRGKVWEVHRNHR